jgi:uncharacterized protein
MPEVIADTSVLQYLHQTGLLELLPKLYGRIIIPQAVAGELSVGSAAGLDVPKAEQLSWAEIRAAHPGAVLSLPHMLGHGEREALTPAAELPDPLVLIDDARARRCAGAYGIRYTGVLGILLRAKQAGHLESVAPVLDQLQALRFRLHPSTRRAVLVRAQELE